MKRRGIIAIIATASLLAFLVPFSFADEDLRAKETDRIQAAGQVLSEIMAAPDKGIPAEVLGKADCVAVVPGMKKGGFVFGANYGRGIATCHTANGWSAPAPFMVGGGSWGLQIGAQEVDLVMLIMNQQGMDNLLNSKFRIGADASAAAGPVGRHAEAATDWKLRAQVLTYSRARGAFAGITLNGAEIKQDDTATQALYGRMIPFKQILSGQVQDPLSNKPFVSAVEKYVAQAKSQENASSASNTGSAPATTTGTTSSSSSAPNASTSAAPGSTSTAPSTSADTSAGTANSAGSTGGVSGAASNSATQAITPAPGASASGSVASNPQGTGATNSTAQPSTGTSETTTATATGPAQNAQDAAQLTTDIQNALRNEPTLSSTNVNITVSTDSVIIGGTVPTEQDRETVKRIVTEHAQGRKVVDNMTVK